MSMEEKDLYEKLKKEANQLISTLTKLKLPNSLVSQLSQLIKETSPSSLADLITSVIEVDFKEKMDILQSTNLKYRFKKTIELLEMQNNKKDDESDDEDNDISELNKRYKSMKLSEEADKIFQRELKRLKKMQPSMADYQVVRTYLEWLLEIPWNISTSNIVDIGKARKQLDDDHFGLDKVKKRILEYLAVCKLRKDMRGPILCLCGPPGVGKTSLGKSIANALGRKFYRISLGGVRDEAEIRGHRRTYVGAMPGLIIQALKKCGTNNPVILLDEIDKMSTQAHHGDPSAAMLEVLDPEQNSSFIDHYINCSVDLSSVLFIATANRIDSITAPLLDRMEIIQLSGYTIHEKLTIAQTHLLPKQIESNGLKDHGVLMDKDVLLDVIVNYTHESGIRSLEREIAAICRFKAIGYTNKVENEVEYDNKVSVEDIPDILGKPKYENELSQRIPMPGVVTGLVYTGSGTGKIMFIEASLSPGKGLLILTGKLGEVLKESAQLALSWVKAHAHKLGITSKADIRLMEKYDIHLHLPEGATPKDGPSAGVAMICALVSLFLEDPLPPSLAMTGEVTLRGQVLPVGGVKEKVISAHHAGIRKIILPDRNKRDINKLELPQLVLDEVKFYFVKTVKDVLKIVFDRFVLDSDLDFHSNL